MENYKIYNFLSFSIIRKDYLNCLLSRFNPEYMWFRSLEKAHHSFKIVVSKRCLKHLEYTEVKFRKISWYVSLTTDDRGIICYVSPKKLGMRIFIPNMTLKNLYVRSLVMLSLLKSEALLLHSCGFVSDDRAIILAGRPGVFKTSILMDAIRLHNAKFLGEENTLVKAGVVYPFPLNHASVTFKIKKFKDENVSGFAQKIHLGLSILVSYIMRRNNFNTLLAKPTPIGALGFVKKGENFEIKRVELDEILSDLVENELLEIDLPPTHSLSGIKRNDFSRILSQKELHKFRHEIENIIRKNFIRVKCYRVITPVQYEPYITSKIIQEIL